MGECSGAKVPSATFGCISPPPSPPGNIPLRLPLFRETMNPDSRMFLRSQYHIYNPHVTFYSFYLVSKKKVSSSKVSPSVSALNSTPPSVFSRTYTPDYPFSCVAQSTPQPRIFIILLNILQSHFKSPSSTQSPLALFIFSSRSEAVQTFCFYFLLISLKAPIWILPLQFHQMALA